MCNVKQSHNNCLRGRATPLNEKIPYRSTRRTVRLEKRPGNEFIQHRLTGGGVGGRRCGEHSRHEKVLDVKLGFRWFFLLGLLHHRLIRHWRLLLCRLLVLGPTGGLCGQCTDTDKVVRRWPLLLLLLLGHDAVLERRLPGVLIDCLILKQLVGLEHRCGLAKLLLLDGARHVAESARLVGEVGYGDGSVWSLHHLGKYNQYIENERSNVRHATTDNKENAFGCSSIQGYLLPGVELARFRVDWAGQDASACYSAALAAGIQEQHRVRSSSPTADCPCTQSSLHRTALLAAPMQAEKEQ